MAKRKKIKAAGSRYAERLLITGGAGFIGSNFLNRMVPRYPRTLFLNVDLLTYAGTLENIEVREAPNYAFEKTDIRDRGRLEKIFKTYRPTGIIHFAAESHVDLSIKNPQIFLETNVLGTHNLLELARRYGVKRFHQISTDEVYGALKNRRGKFTEASPLAPRNPYSASKAAADLLVLSYVNTFGLDAVITRSSNNYGPRQDRTKLIPLFITNLLRGKRVPLYGRGLQIRDWLFVGDNVEAIDRVFRRGKKGEVYNIGGGFELTNFELTKQLLALAGAPKSAIRFIADRPGHDFRYALDNRKMRRELGWSPRTRFPDGLTETFRFYAHRPGPAGRN